MDKEKIFVLRVIDETDFGCRMLAFATNKEGEVHPCDYQSISESIFQNSEELGSEVGHISFTLFRDHGQIKVMDQICKANVFHAAGINVVEKLLIN